MYVAVAIRVNCLFVFMFFFICSVVFNRLFANFFVLFFRFDVVKNPNINIRHLDLNSSKRGNLQISCEYCDTFNIYVDSTMFSYCFTNSIHFCFGKNWKINILTFLWVSQKSHHTTLSSSCIARL